MARLIAIILAALPLIAEAQTLKDVFSLNGDQAQKISSLFTDYDSLRKTSNARITELTFGLLSQFLQLAPDPAKVGASYAEAEAIRRLLSARRIGYRLQVSALLTASQVTRLQTLQNAITLQPLLTEADCAYLIPKSLTVPTIAIRAGDFEGSGSFVLTAPITPSKPPTLAPDFCGSSTFPLALREYLNATDAQVAAIAQARAGYDDIDLRRRNRIADVQVEIRDELAKAQPDPAALGVRYVEINYLSKDLRDQAVQLQQRARAALTGDQAARLKALDDLATAQSALNILQACDLLTAPASSTQGLVFSSSCRVM